ncbi:MAG: hypothetical protein HY717_15190 [Planctomycetes bacterium]|nr:hypothetical protein [Planctomycetota bacterium]
MKQPRCERSSRRRRSLGSVRDKIFLTKVVVRWILKILGKIFEEAIDERASIGYILVPLGGLAGPSNLKVIEISLVRLVVLFFRGGEEMMGMISYP